MSSTPARSGVREELRQHLLQHGILWSTKDAPVVGRDGSAPPWMLYTWNLTLTEHGSRLAAASLLDLLGEFEGTQLAGYGYTAMPLVSACVLLGGGRYTGLCVRTERKTYGAGRQVDGPLDPSRKVVIVDDAMSSGQAFRAARDALEAAGLEVEGAVTLVHFPYRGGRERAEGVGYKIRSVFDVWADLQIAAPPYRPGHLRAAPRIWSVDRVPDGLHPAVAARAVAQHYLTTGEALLPPRTFAAPENGDGGTFVSLRRTRDDLRLSRQGFWHFDPAEADPRRDVVLATVQMCRFGRITADQLAAGKLAVTFLPALERCEPADLDFGRYGIVVRSTVWPPKAGGALPNTQAYTSAVEQLHHAQSNAGLTRHEPHDLWRHEVIKRVEPGFTWPGYGTDAAALDGWAEDPDIAGLLVNRVRAARSAALGGLPLDGVPLPPDLIPAPVDAVGVTLHRHGRPMACSVSSRGDLDGMVRNAVDSAMKDQRFHAAAADLQAADLVVSILHDAETIGVATTERAARQIRPGHDSLFVDQGAKSAIFLESVLPHYEWSRERLVKELIVKARITEPPYRWTTFKTEAWLAAGDAAPLRLRCGFVDHRGLAMGVDEVSLMAGFVANSIGDDGMPRYRLLPALGMQDRRGTLARVLHAILALAEAGELTDNAEWQALARRSVAAVLQSVPENPEKLQMGELRGSFVALASLLETIVSPSLPGLLDDAHRLARALHKTLRADGAIALPGMRTHAADHDFMPGLVLSALARYALATGVDAGIDWDAHLRWYRHRFRMLHPWGLATWQAQAWSSVHELTGSRAAGEFVFEVADWMLDGQLHADGSFLARELYPDGPSFHTAFIAEGIVAAAQVAQRIGDQRRFDLYRASWEAAMRWMSELVVRADDVPLLVAGEVAVGGVRTAPASGDQRIDYTSHTLIALISGLRAFGEQADRPVLVDAEMGASD